MSVDRRHIRVAAVFCLFAAACGMNHHKFAARHRPSAQAQGALVPDASIPETSVTAPRVTSVPLRTGDVSGSTSRPRAVPLLLGIHKIQHVIVIMQENRSFDTYFGTYPGADGIPMQNGMPK